MISSLDSSDACSPISGFEPAPRPWVRLAPNWILTSAFEPSSACASVLATKKSAPSSPLSFMLLTALHPAPPTPRTTMRGVKLVLGGTCSEFNDISVLLLDLPATFPQRHPYGCTHALRRSASASLANRSSAYSPILLDPVHEPSHQLRRRVGKRRIRKIPPLVLGMRCEHRQPHCGRIFRAAHCLRQPGNAHRPA